MTLILCVRKGRIVTIMAALHESMPAKIAMISEVYFLDSKTISEGSVTAASAAIIHSRKW